MRRDPLYVLAVIAVVLLILHLLQWASFGVSWPVLMLAVVVCVLWIARG
jgi:hypothetical protein